MRIAVLSNVTTEVLAGMLRKEHDVWLPPGFGAWMETALATPDDLVAFNPEAVFLLLDSSFAPFDAAGVVSAKAALERALPAAAVIVPDLVDLADATGGFTDERMWKFASMPWSLKGLRAIVDEMDRLLRIMREGAPKKALALDLDGTLWSGVIGEDGPDGIRPFAAFQRALKALADRGVVLVALSKNNPADVEPAWSDPRMVLKREDFAAVRVGWDDKPSGLVSVAAELNLGVGAFVFVDDSPAERAQMAAALPDVAVPEFAAGEGEAGLLRLLRRLERLYFPELRITDEDRRRAARYSEDAARRGFAVGLSADEYLAGLEIVVDVHAARPEEFARVAQLSQRTNQLNAMTNRYSPEDVARLAADPRSLLVVAGAADRFGDLGIVAFALARVDGPEAVFVDWAMSCRAMNRRIEHAVEERAEAMLAARGVSVVRAEWRRTPRNAPAERLFDSFGFSVVESAEDHRRYVLNLPRRERLRHFARFAGASNGGDARNG